MRGVFVDLGSGTGKAPLNLFVRMHRNRISFYSSCCCAAHSSHTRMPCQVVLAAALLDTFQKVHISVDQHI